MNITTCLGDTMAKKTVEVTPVTEQRKYKSALEFDHDLFRLENAVMQKNQAWSKKMPAIWEVMTHKHFFHTNDSDGKPQTRSTAALGHFHPIEQTKTPDGPPKIKCGPAMKEVMIRDEDSGLYKKTAVQLTGKEAHIHETAYVYSERLKARKVNEEAIKAQSSFIAKETGQMTDDERKAVKDTAREAVTE